MTTEGLAGDSGSGKEVKLEVCPQTRAVSTECANSDNIVSYYYDFPPYYRWVYVACTLVLAFIFGAPFLNWPPFTTLFDEAGAYNSVCTPDSEGYREGDDGLLYCKEKLVWIDTLATFTGSTMFCFTFVGGVLLDCFGSKVCTATGGAGLLLGWLIIASSGIHFNGFKAGMFFLGAGTDLCIFGLLPAANLFPGYNSTVIAMLGTARSLTFTVPIIMKALLVNAGFSLRAIALGFSAILVASLCVVIFFVPSQPFPRTTAHVQLDFEPGEGKISLREHLNRRPRISWDAFSKTAKAQAADWFTFARTWGYLAFLPVAATVTIRNGYYASSYQVHLPDVKTFYEIMNPLSFIPCPLLGLFADKVSAALCVAFLAICAAGSMLLAMFDTLVTQYISVLFNWLFIAFISSQFYCYVGAVYPQRQMGKLAGFAMLFGGICGLASNNMYNFASQSSGNLRAMDILVVGFGVAALAIALCLYVFIERPIQRRTAQIRRERAERDLEHAAAVKKLADLETSNA